MKLTDFDYVLPDELIAQFPLDARDRSRLLVLKREDGNIEHKQFFQIVDYLRSGDALVINDTKVFPARLFGRKESGGKAEILLLEKLKEQQPCEEGFAEEWKCLINSSKPPRAGSKIRCADNLTVDVISRDAEFYRVSMHSSEKIATVIEKNGYTPLPPYIKRDEPDRYEELDRVRYQAVYARESGAVAAPTAGLHFTDSLLEKLKQRGVSVIPLTLHVGFATFNPVREQEIEKHAMHSEYCMIPEKSASILRQVREQGGTICAVGTTVVRALEFFADAHGNVAAGEGMNDLFIYPGYRFRVVDCMITNFHLPRSTLLMLVSAFAGREHLLNAYADAIEKRYRFYSYGDSMLII